MDGLEVLYILAKRNFLKIKFDPIWRKKLKKEEEKKLNQTSDTLLKNVFKAGHIGLPYPGVFGATVRTDGGV